MTDSERAYSEAKSRIFWGDKKEETMSILLSSGSFSEEQASKILDAFIKDRNKSARYEATKQIAIGLSLIALSAYLTYEFVGPSIPNYWERKELGGLLLPGVYGFFKLSKGIDLWIRPRFRFSD